MVQTQLYKLRDISCPFVGRAYVLYCIDNVYMVFANQTYDMMVVDTQFHKFYGRPFARVLYFFMNNISR